MATNKQQAKRTGLSAAIDENFPLVKRKRLVQYRGNQMMIEKVLACADQAEEARFNRILREIPASRVAQTDKQTAAEEKRRRKAAKRLGQ